MGTLIEKICNACGFASMAQIGWTMNAAYFRCKSCHRGTSVSRTTVQEAWQQFEEAARTISGHGAELSGQSSAMRQQLKELAESSGGFDEQLQQLAGPCECGGEFGVYAEPRCPQCRSTDLTSGQNIACVN